MSVQTKLGKRPGKSFLLTAGLAIIAAAAPFVNDYAERCCGIEITEVELQHLLYTFVGSAGVGGAVGIHRRHVASRNDRPGGGNIGAVGPVADTGYAVHHPPPPPPDRVVPETVHHNSHDQIETQLQDIADDDEDEANDPDSDDHDYTKDENLPPPKEGGV